VFITPEGKLSPFTYGCTIDLEIIYITLRNYIYTSKKLNSDDKFVEECKEKLDNLMPLQISERYGTLQEWIEDYEEYEPGHRHTSHLVGLYPGDCIRPSDNELFHAAEKSVERRVKNGSCNCNWSVIWEAIFYARFLEGEVCQEFLDYYIKCFVKGVMFNIFEVKIFQIDAVLGYNAVINEMLIQSYEGEIDERTITLLPALPKKWSKGSIENIRVRGGINADLYWDNGKLTKAVLRANNDRTAKIYYKDIVKYNVSTECQIKDNYLTINMKKGESYTISR
jgi:alpha-L-fucosidase 2